jgi:hypothetical protein
MMSGKISPASIGLGKAEYVVNLLRLTNNLFSMFTIFKILPIIWFFGPVILNCYYYSLVEIITFALFWSILSSFGFFYFSNIIIAQLIYFYIICYYLRIKLMHKNLMLKRYSLNNLKLDNKKLNKIIESLTDIYREINDYNDNYWSQFLFWFSFLFTTVMCLFLFPVIYAEINLLTKLILTITNSLYGIIIIYFLNTASSIYYETNNAYKYLNKISLISNKKFKFNNKLKVNNLNLIVIEINLFSKNYYLNL